MLPKHFIASRIDDDVRSGRTPKVVLRFPPEPNGYLHLGHVKSIVLNSSLAEAFGGELNLRFDDTNPKKENMEYVDAIKRDALWLSDRFTRLLWTSDYFETIHRCAVHLIERGLAYVDDSSPEDMRAMRGDFRTPGRASVFRGRAVAENLELFAAMCRGDFAEGTRVLRARIDLVHPNLNMRDPTLYRISHTEHHNTGARWHAYPMYDLAHPLADAIEGITHSLCTLEFEDHRPLYDWVVDTCFELLGNRPVQIEFARLEMEGVVLSKRKLNSLVDGSKVHGWDAPEMPTVSGLRNRGFTAALLSEFVTRCGFSKANSLVPAGVLTDCVCDVLGPVVERRMAVLDPVPLELEGLLEPLAIDMPNHPKDPSRGTRPLTLTSRVWVDRADVRALAEPDFWRLYPGNWVRLKNGLNVLVKDVEAAGGHITRVRGEVDAGSRHPKDAKAKAKAVVHWLSDIDAKSCSVTRYGPLLTPGGEFDPGCVANTPALVERGLGRDVHYEFERSGYFYIDADGGVHHLADLKGKAGR